MDQIRRTIRVTTETRQTTVIKWSARTLSTLILMFWIFFLVASLIGDEASGSRPLNWSDYLILVTMVTALLGLVLAWKWELIGAVMTLFAVVVCAVVNFRVLYFPGTLIPIAACLFLLSWWFSRTIKNPER